MAPIPIYTQSPINATKASGVTPQTAPAEVGGSQSAATTTATPSQHSYPPAQPGAAAPRPTGNVQGQSYAPVQPTPTARVEDHGPPAPQPGAVPMPPGARSVLPPPPKAGETYHPPAPTAAPSAASMPYPPQMAVPAPTMPYPAQRGTSTATTGSYSQQSTPAGLGYGSQGQFDHPPGYQQNIHASDLNSSQRAAHFADVSHERRGNSSSGGEADGEDGVWDAARKMVKAAGESLSAAESEVWRRINKE